MLIQLRIRDFAIVEDLELELATGMTAVTGETGAGKSILVDAIGLLLGDRADSGTVRQGAERADISAVFDLEQLPTARAWLAERDLDTERECHLRRVIASNGRSRNYINGVPQPAQALRDLGELLVDIHGQHEHQSLLRRDSQRQLLDHHAGHLALVSELARAFQTWSERRQELQALRQASTERDARSDILGYHLRELTALNLAEGEVAELAADQRRLANASQLLETGQRLLTTLTDGDGDTLTDRLNHSLHDLESLKRLDPRLGPIGELLNAAVIQIQEAAGELRGYVQDLDLDPAHLARVEQRLTAAHQLARKHRITPEELPALRVRFETELDTLQHSETRLETLEQAVKDALAAYRHHARELSERRMVAAHELDERISQTLAGLGMPGGRFATVLTVLDKPTATGAENVEFQVSANPGQPLRPLAKVASGGELSRISLAIQVIAAHAARIPTLIFDEVDTGIGGGVAEVVGRQLRALGQGRQVLCVTHLPQVAAQAHQQLKVEKQTDGANTHTEVRWLAMEERVTEIARMLGGLELTANTLAHAQEMVEKAATTTPASA
ncbi:protein used in recombination and DNA repair with nucleoside triphosphate hydrolase domain [Candidatus Competibacter denitrificans Run_A_D11]|uniref:DNA repair protein RecN n=1 Tax=Candidatus Competibacter denitrificans Run_A_D11 TaxID=1400863 RepID=W6M743_9GAMM|nr:DNA repair protein RecN [Candidatus Competibacter denitrificans]CDI03736.1 protein used in recombination and DNA repair with nucleoside triphosphate hydrolase domain [Candidatus Competibacter denitrificans Run_A_D11]HAS85994.1 DNA repair protein RecN [Candidatus Competibacteraceae bacterium]HRC68411.1 DNA repair protein RecN [Candidatus Competibacter denitrificans]